MSPEKPDPLSDVIRGLGLLLRAAKTTVERVPKKGLEEVVVETAREVGRAFENVAGTVEREVFTRARRKERGDPQRPREDDARKKDGEETDGGPPDPPKPAG